MNPKNRAKRRWRCLAYQACRARSFVRLVRVASMVRVSPALRMVSSPIDTMTHHDERPSASRTNESLRPRDGECLEIVGESLRTPRSFRAAFVSTTVARP